MEITQSNSVAENTSAQTSANQAEREEVSSDFETFLRMLTVQLQNQDPLNPVESSDYALQLATFSSVEQQVKTNDILSSLGQQMGLLGLSQLSGWVGMEARVAAPAYFDGSAVTVYSEIPTIADAAIMVVRNDSGEEVYRSAVDVSEDSFQWAGNGVDGQPVVPGLYKFEVESYVNEELVSTKVAQIYSVVTEAKFDNDEMVIVLRGGAEVPASSITAIRKEDT